jgi:hypothetical protein
MDILELLKKKEFLGREFLTWLWYKSETQQGLFSLENSQQVELWIDDKIVLQSDGYEGVQMITCQGENLDFSEARHALKEGKKVTQAKIRLIIDSNEWTFTLDAAWLNFRGLKTPKVMLDPKEDPAGLFHEKAYLLDTAVSSIEQLLIRFLNDRISDHWDIKEVPAIRKWVQGGELSEN